MKYCSTCNEKFDDSVSFCPKDGEVLEGLMPNDLSLTTAEGFLINPPDLRSNVQRMFVPRTSLESLTVLAVIGAARRQRRAPADVMQVPMFGE